MWPLPELTLRNELNEMKRLKSIKKLIISILSFEDNQKNWCAFSVDLKNGLEVFPPHYFS